MEENAKDIMADIGQLWKSLVVEVKIGKESSRIDVRWIED